MKNTIAALRRAGRTALSWTDTHLDAVLDYAYLLLFGVILLIAFRGTTTFVEPEIPYAALQRIRLLLVLVVGAKLARSRDWTLRELLIAVLIVGTLVRSWQRVGRLWVLEAALLAVGARGMDFRKLVRAYLCVTGTALLVTVVLALTGVFENLVYFREGHRRISFGIIYPTDFAAHVFFLTAAYAWLREKHIRWWELGVVLALGAFCLVFCDARNSVLCLVLLAAGLALLRLLRTRAAKRGGEFALPGWIGGLLCASAPILAVIILLLTKLYSGENAGMVLLDRLFSQRLSIGHNAFDWLPIYLFGNDVYMTGWGGVSEITEDLIARFFFLDSSYVNILFCFGAVTLVLVLALFVYSAVREKRSGAWERLWILAVAALQCMMEHHLMELTYNVFLLLPLAASTDAPLAGETRQRL